MENLKDLFYMIKEKRNVIILCIMVILLLIGSFFGVYMINQDNKESKSDSKKQMSNLSTISTDVSNKASSLTNYRVEIKGEVVKPGVYTLDSEKRVIDVINKAEGLTRNADTSIINMSKKIKDEMVIIIYSKKEVEEFMKSNKKKQEEEKTKLEICNQDIFLKNDACLDDDIIDEEKNTKNNNKQDDSSSKDTANNKVSINTATLEELMTLSGIGKSKAQSIIDYRQKEGEFKSIEDIMNVSGIGESLFAKIKDSITV